MLITRSVGLVMDFSASLELIDSLVAMRKLAPKMSSLAGNIFAL